MVKNGLLTLLLTAILSAMPVAKASTVAVWFSGGTLVQLPDNDSWTVGFNFQPRSAIVVDGLGFYDHGADGLSSSHPLGLWNATLNLPPISTTSITTANSTLAGPSINNGAGQFRFVDIDPVVLVPKYKYTVGGTILAGQTDAWYGGTVDPGLLEWDTSLIDFANQGGLFYELTDPANFNLAFPFFYTGDSFGVVSLRARFATVADIPPNFPIIDLPVDFPIRRIPEPGMLGLIGLGFAALAFSRRYRGERIGCKCPGQDSRQA